jgi:hypothetical protein
LVVEKCRYRRVTLPSPVGVTLEKHMTAGDSLSETDVAFRETDYGVGLFRLLAPSEFGKPNTFPVVVQRMFYIRNNI